MTEMLTSNTYHERKKPQLTRVWQKWRFSAPQTHLWLAKVQFSASTFVVKIATFAKPENVVRQLKKASLLHRKSKKHLQYSYEG